MGKLLQVVQETASKVSTTTQIPSDDTIPQNTEGAEILSVSFTPQSATSTLYFFFRGTFFASGAGTCTFALFVDSTADALRSWAVSADANIKSGGVLQHSVASGSTSARTYKIRFGPNAATTIYNYRTTGDDMGGVSDLGTLRIMEVEA